ncbi:RDD family protein [Aldersonia sp. NBC_00410]|uniref:RDD family protein n=1 Tax=Aldersonia sp. NBC_00410 TaxID=2975954 RepID=UPI002256AC0D|nr:RDD family protein [Aldersonia sp. NBC_00410]MCX5042177.1 RDD family protein [Aldersonia sp. NBC_00410]
MRSPEHRPAGVVTRTIAAGIDVIVVVTAIGSLYVGWVLTRLLFAPQEFTFPDIGALATMTVFIMFSFVYLTTFWAVSGRTVGAVAMGLRVVSRRGQLLGWPRSAVRAWLYVLFGFGLYWAVLDRRRRSLQDILLGTAVVYDWHANPKPHLGPPTDRA